jgi:drug/metabolite transporter (DMT)-like permease
MPFFTAMGAHWFVPGASLGKAELAGLCCAFLGVVTESVGNPQSNMIMGDTMLLPAAVSGRRPPSW